MNMTLKMTMMEMTITMMETKMMMTMMNMTYDDEDGNNEPPDVRLDPGVSVCPGDVPDVDGGPAQSLARHAVPHHALHPPVGRPEELHQRPLVVIPLPGQAAVRILLWSSYTLTPQSFIDLILFN